MIVITYPCANLFQSPLVKGGTSCRIDRGDGRWRSGVQAIVILTNLGAQKRA